MGSLIVIEGTDGSGKATQTELLAKHLHQMDIAVRQLSFPCYTSESSALVKMYLNGDFGKRPEDVNAFAASTFYSVDRFASFKSDWESSYRSGVLHISDRYTISNAIHQGVKLPKEQRAKYLEWLYDFEYNKMGIPAPDLVFYLDVPTELTNELRTKREQNTHTKPDIHEKDWEYLRQCRKSALEIAESSGWTIIHCSNGRHMRTPQDIHEELFEKTLKFLQQHSK